MRELRCGLKRSLKPLRFGGCALASLMICLATPAAAQIQVTDPSILQTVRSMKPGEFLWAPDVAPSGPVMIIISLPDQRAFVYRNGVPIGISTVSTGKEGHATPTGVFTILQKRVDHKSNLYNNAPMPYMQRLTWDGIALHAGNLPGYPASHGCIRLPKPFAQKLYEVTKLGLTVIITDGDAVPRIAPKRDRSKGPASETPPPARSAGSLSFHRQARFPSSSAARTGASSCCATGLRSAVPRRGSRAAFPIHRPIRWAR